MIIDREEEQIVIEGDKKLFLNNAVIFRRRNFGPCIDLFIVDEFGKQVFICFFNKDSQYSAILQKDLKTDFKKLFK